MKKITLLLTIMALVLAFGSAYAMEMTEGRNNGATVFSPGNYSNVPGSALERQLATKLGAVGGVAEAESNLELNNGITIFAAGPVDFDSVSTIGAEESIGMGSAAGGLSEDDAPLELNNGITIFDKGPIVFDTD